MSLNAVCASLSVSLSTCRIPISPYIRLEMSFLFPPGTPRILSKTTLQAVTISSLHKDVMLSSFAEVVAVVVEDDVVVVVRVVVGTVVVELVVVGIVVVVAGVVVVVVVVEGVVVMIVGIVVVVSIMVVVGSSVVVV